MTPKQTAIATAVACVIAAGQALANGTDPTVVAGQASFSASGSSLNVTNNPGAIINWQGFSIGAGESTRFIQQSATSSVLNRVIGPDPSLILGTLTSNGRVFLINPSGILFGQGARIEVAALVASTLNLSNQDFLAGRLNFTANPLAGKVENRGSITTPSGGSVYLVGSDVSNSGIINSPQGQVILAAGQSVNIFDTSTPGVSVELAADDNNAVNLGEILAQSGQVGIYGAVLRNTGTINADQVMRDASGKIVLRAKRDVTLEAGSRLSANGEQAGMITVQSETGTTLVSGTIEAVGKGAGQTGATVKILGETVNLSGATIDVSGDAGGGLVLVGGNFHGAGPEQNSQSTSLDGRAVINANAAHSGDGGRIAVWSDGDTTVGGTLTARGGANSGNGGFVETSGKKVLLADSTNITTLAPSGTTGLWLLDPVNWTIAISGGDETPTSVTNSLATSNRLIDATHDITVGLAITDAVTWTTPQTLTLNAGHDVLINAAMTASTAGSGIVLKAGNDVNVTGALTASAAGSLIDMTAGNNVSVAVVTASGGGSVNLRANNDVIVNGMITVDTGTVNLRADNDGSRAGTVTFPALGGVSAVTTNIYYNPTSYANYTSDNTYFRTKVVAGALNSYMLLFMDGLSANKTYDGTMTAALNGTATIAPAAGDAVNLAGSGTITNFSSKDVHTELLTLNGYSISGGQAYKYSLFQPSNLTASISAKTVLLSATKIYDGTTSLTGAVTLDTGITGEALNYSGATASDAHVATANKFVDAITLVSNTGLASNYALPSLDATTAPVTISTATLIPTLTNNPITKTYDGNTDAPFGFTPTYGFFGLVSGDTAAVLTNSGAAYNDKNVTAASKVTVSGLAISSITGSHGSASSDYALDATSKNVTADITQANLLVTGLTAAGRVYDTTTVETLGGSASVTALSGDNVTLGGTAAGAFANKNVGTAKAVTVTGNTINGSDAGNYALVQQAGLTADINPRPLTVSAVTDSRVYDRTTSSVGAPTYTGLQPGDNLSGPLTQAYASKNVLGTLGSTLVATGPYSVNDGNGGNNYTVSVNTASGSITPLTLVGSITAANKVYDVDNTATILTRTLATPIAGDTVSYVGGTALFSDKNAAPGKTVTATGLSLAGGDAGNYTVNSTATTQANITPASLGITASSTSKTYGSTMSFGGTEFSSTGLKNGETVGSVSLTSAGAVATAGVAGGPYGITPGAANGGTFTPSNYTITYVNGVLSVTPVSLVVTADAKSKVYGTTDPALTFGVAGLVNNPTLGIVDTATTTLSGALSRVPGETVRGGPYAITQGTLAANSNYILSNFIGNALAITPAMLDVAAHPQSKRFGTIDPALTYGVAGLVSNPALGIADTAVSVLSGALIRVPGESTLGSPYAITRGSLAANGNYTLGFTPSNLIIIGAAAEPIAGFNPSFDPGQFLYVGVTNSAYYYPSGKFWHISLNPDNADPGFDVIWGTTDLSSRLSRSMDSCESVTGGGFCGTWSFPQQLEKVDKK